MSLILGLKGGWKFVNLIVSNFASATLTKPHRRFIQLGAVRSGSELKIDLLPFFNDNKSFECHFLGNTTGQAWIPVMIKWWREGKFPIEKIVKYFPAKDAVEALHKMEDGTVIKPVLVW